MNVNNKEGDDIFYMARRHLGPVMVSMFEEVLKSTDLMSC